MLYVVLFSASVFPLRYNSFFFTLGLGVCWSFLNGDGRRFLTFLSSIIPSKSICPVDSIIAVLFDIFIHLDNDWISDNVVGNRLLRHTMLFGTRLPDKYMLKTNAPAITNAKAHFRREAFPRCDFFIFPPQSNRNILSNNKPRLKYVLG